MSTGDSQANDKMIIKADLGENGGLVAFGMRLESFEPDEGAIYFRYAGYGLT